MKMNTKETIQWFMAEKFIFALVLVGMFVLSCKKQEDSSLPDSRYVAAVSSGVLGRMEPVKVLFTQSQDTSKPLGSGVFTIRPAAKGELS